jgi:Xaa-Pro dipeptidase
VDKFQIDVVSCQGRQRRLLDRMQSDELDVVIVTLPEHVQWLTGTRYAWTLRSAAVITSDGRVTLVAPQSAPEVVAADEVLTYEAKWHSTLRNDQPQECMRVLEQAVARRCQGQNVGVEFSGFGHHWMSEPRRVADIEPALYQLRRRKDADELELIKKAIAGTARMYECAREIIEPGISELEVFNQLQAAAVNEFSEMLTGTGNDYQCGARGGPPRAHRVAAAGELFILDLGPAFRGYFADNARTIAVTSPTDAQQEAWAFVVRTLEHVQQTVRPGVSAKTLFQEAEEILREAPIGQFNHHLGHGIGLFPHEAPHLNPHWDDIFEEGDVFTAEPGLYAPELQVGMRIENDFRVTANGVELLTDFDLSL